MPEAPQAPQGGENAENAGENVEEPAAEAPVEAAQSGDEDNSDMWEETFKSHTDSKPNGFFIFFRFYRYMIDILFECY